MSAMLDTDGRKGDLDFILPPGLDGAATAVDVHDTEFVEVQPPPRPEFAAPPFPSAAMPGVWRELVRLWEPWTEAHPASIVVPALIMLGVHGGEGVRLGRERPIEYLGLIGPSTIGRKDTGVNIA
ncbi:MAG: hypothetical protein SF182_22775, partial [Deltaproteobacteria bacterium]|nr:hypothetical protein [Deltaproteobacteria bacterium]